MHYEQTESQRLAKGRMFGWYNSMVGAHNLSNGRRATIAIRLYRRIIGDIGNVEGRSQSARSRSHADPVTAP